MYLKLNVTEEHLETISNTNKYGILSRRHFMKCYAGSVI